MINLTSALQQLREGHKQAQEQVEKFQSAISLMEDLVGRNGSIPAHTGARPGHSMSAAARRRIAQAQKARWARVKKESQPPTGKKTSAAAPVKRTISAAGRRRIAAAQRARWAKLKAA